MFLILTLSLLACSDDTASGPGGSSSLAYDTADTAAASQGSCTSEDLCTRSIDECEVQMALDQCLDWYATEDNCADMAGYLACNCDCFQQDTCDSYFACGESCYANYCVEG